MLSRIRTRALSLALPRAAVLKLILVLTLGLPAAGPALATEAAAPGETAAATASPSPPVSHPMAERMQACTPCHGAEGRAAPDGYYPRIAGKPAGYLFEQLRNFRDGRRNQAAMTHLLSHLSDDYLAAMARYFADLDLPWPPPQAPTAGPSVLARGEALVRQGDEAAGLPACTSCHGKTMTGREPGTPGLLGLPRDYLVAQIGAWQAGQRLGKAPDCMADIARRLKPDDVFAVTHWLAAQAVPGHAAAVVDENPAPLPLTCAKVTLPAPAPAPDAAHADTGTVPAGDRAGDAVARGAYLARAANCQGCHTARGGVPYAGGLGIATPFGTVYAGNLTPDRETGLGNWSAEDFRRALHEGRSRDGRLLYPAFPYQNYGLLSAADSDDLFAFLQSLPASRQPNRVHDLRFPYSTGMALRAWRALFFEQPSLQARPDQSAEWNRGDYLVRALGHCDACHSPRNRLGAIPDAARFDGGMMPGQPWYAPSLKSNAEAGVGDWPLDQVVALLRDGISNHATVTGPMAEVVAGSTTLLDATDLRAMAVWLQALAGPSAPTDAAARPPAASAQDRGRADTDAGPRRRGAQLYLDYCSDCHSKDGRGRAGSYPALAGNRAVTLPVATNVIRIVADGGFAPSTAGNPRPFGMPPFGQQFQAAQIADVVTYIRQAWGNQAAGVTPNDVTQARP